MEAVLRRDRDDAVPPPRLADDAPDRRAAFSARNRAIGDVGGDHEVLDQVAGAVLARDGERLDLAVLRHRRGLDRVEIERAGPLAHLLEQTRGAVLQPELRLEPVVLDRLLRLGSAPLEPRADLLVLELRAVRRDRAVDVVAPHRAVGAELELDDEDEPLAPSISDVRSVDSASGSIG